MKKAIIIMLAAIMMTGCGTNHVPAPTLESEGEENIITENIIEETVIEVGKAYTKVWTGEDKMWIYDPNTGEEWHLYNVERIENYFNEEIVNLRTANDLNHEYYYCIEMGEVWRDNIHVNTFAPMEEKYTVVYSSVERV